MVSIKTRINRQTDWMSRLGRVSVAFEDTVLTKIQGSASIGSSLHVRHG